MFDMSTSRSHFFFKVVLVTLDLAAVETYTNQNCLSLEALGKKFQKRLTENDAHYLFLWQKLGFSSDSLLQLSHQDHALSLKTC
jgi:hypothetical protein